MNREDWRPGTWLGKVNCAVEGVLWAAKTQRHMRYHFTAAIAVLLVALFYQVSIVELILLSLAATLVLFAELVNTALEVLVDLVSPEYHPLAQRAKDVAAGAVLVTSCGAILIGYLALCRYISSPSGAAAAGVGQPPVELAVISILVIIILVVLLKARFGKGSPLHGGMPSGHSAIAFSIATSIAISSAGPLFSVLALAMAAMVSHSRLLLGIHSCWEVVAGALLGVGTTLLLFMLFA
ncbi:diacylglycerol kinase [Desulfuromonas sp. TF]|uniref:diacylglycerol kinase n=1 Tax=Desulfuromonas sp. TF TaxID=1232410 RepID=UPI000414E9D8|nr:diacylglycerol kinase [Desulfuromonas sp. TF]